MTESQVAEHFPGCPTCGRTNGYLNAGRAHWSICDDHRLAWPIGWNLFSHAGEETEEEQRAAWERVDDTYDLVEPDGSPFRPSPPRAVLPLDLESPF